VPEAHSAPPVFPVDSDPPRDTIAPSLKDGDAVTLKPIPFLTRKELRELLAQAEPTADGCLLLIPTSPLHSANNIILRGRTFKATRCVWAELRGDAGLNEHEVIHIAECPHTGGTTGRYTPICINVEHLTLDLTRCKSLNSRERIAVYRRNA
jgi:hypothetical protein